MTWCAAGWIVRQPDARGAYQVPNSMPLIRPRKGLRIATERRFFPERPPDAVLHTHTGILEEFGAGMALGSVILRTGSGSTIRFFLGGTMRINAVRIRCARPSVCPNWPSDLVLGATEVTVTHWTTTYRGHGVRATDEIDY